MSADSLTKYVLVTAVAFVVTFLLTPFVIWAAPRLGLVDQPDARRIHRGTIPRAGGFAVFLGFHAGCVAIFCLPWGGFGAHLQLEWWKPFLTASFFLVLVGLMDDRFGLSPVTKLLCQCVAGATLYAGGIRFVTVSGILLSPLVDFVLTVVWCVGFVNAFNLIDGLDGLAAGLATVASLGLAGLAVLQHTPGDALVLLALAAASLAFLRYNFNPARVFLGDTGSMFIGLALAAVSLGMNAKSATVATLAVPVLAAGVPIIDAALAIWRRSMRRLSLRGASGGSAGKGEGVFTSDRDHVHHRLLELLGSQRRVAWALYIVNAVIVGVGLIASASRSWSLAIYLAAFAVGTVVIVRHLANVEMWTSGVAVARGLRRPTGRVMAVLFYPVADFCLLLAAYAMASWFAANGQFDFANFKRDLLTAGPVVLGVPFIALGWRRTYRRVWSKARLLDFLALMLALTAGNLLAAAVRLGLAPDRANDLLREAALFTLVGAPLLVMVRLFPRALMDAASYLSSRQERPAAPARRALLYGAGYGCVLYLRSRTYSLDLDGEGMIVVGLLDDDRNLYGRYLYGHRVLGGIETAQRLIEMHRVQDIVVTTKLEGSVLGRLVAIASQRGAQIWFWEQGLRKYDEKRR